MNAQDIRELNEKLQEQMLNSQSPVEHDAGFKSLLLSLLAEIAAQNAEATALLKRHLNPSLGNDQDLSDSLKKQADEVLAYAQDFKDWQKKNSDLVKYPD